MLAKRGYRWYDTFLMDGEGHCIFRLMTILLSECFFPLIICYHNWVLMYIISFYTQNVALQYGGFKEWASTIIQQESSIIVQQENEPRCMHCQQMAQNFQLVHQLWIQLLQETTL